MEKQWKQWQTLFLAVPKSLQMVTAAMKLEDASWKKSYDKLSVLKSRGYKDPSSQSYGFSRSYVWVSESWIIKKVEHLRTDVFELWCQRMMLSNCGAGEGL